METLLVSLIFSDSLFSLFFSLFSDSDYAGCKTTRKSTSGSIFLRNGLINWSSKLQELVALSSMEAELVSACDAVKHAVSIKQLAVELGIEEPGPVPMQGDNQASLKWMTTDDMVSKRSKHIGIKYHYTRDMIKQQQVSWQYVNTSDNSADLMTKPLPSVTLHRLCAAIGLRKM